MDRWIDVQYTPKSLFFFLSEVKVSLNHLPDVFGLFVRQTGKIQFTLHHAEMIKSKLKIIMLTVFLWSSGFYCWFFRFLIDILIRRLFVSALNTQMLQKRFCQKRLQYLKKKERDILRRNL